METANEQTTEDPGPTFDVRIAEDYRKLSKTLLDEQPELRSVLVVLDYSGNFNDVTQTSLWFHRGRQIDGGIAGLSTMMTQVLRTVGVMYSRVLAAAKDMTEAVVQLYAARDAVLSTKVPDVEEATTPEAQGNE